MEWEIPEARRLGHAIFEFERRGVEDGCRFGLLELLDVGFDIKLIFLFVHL